MSKLQDTGNVDGGHLREKNCGDLNCVEVFQFAVCFLRFNDDDNDE